jgi:hypothetical protein
MALPEEYLNKSPAQQRASLNKAMKAYRRADPSDRKRKAREALIEQEADHQSPSMLPTVLPEEDASSILENQSPIRVWQPSSRGRFLSGLAVPFQGLVMTRSKYADLLQDRLQALIEADPDRAREVLAGSVSVTSEPWSLVIVGYGEEEQRLQAAIEA